MKYLFLLAMFTLTGCAEKQNEVLITADELENLLQNNDVKIISTQNPLQYDSAHIPGAVNIYSKELNNDAPVKGMLKPVPELAMIFQNHGISRKNPVIVYDSGDAKYAGRLFWILSYMGFNDVRMLDGNLRAWNNEMLPVESGKANPGNAVLHPKIRPSIKVQLVELKSKLNHPKTMIVDVRSPGEFDGTSERSAGHIPGAINLPHTELLDTLTKIKKPDELHQILKNKQINKENEIILYCHTSTRAGLVFMILTEILNYPDVRVYDGAYEEWSQTGNAIEN